MPAIQRKKCWLSLFPIKAYRRDSRNVEIWKVKADYFNIGLNYPCCPVGQAGKELNAINGEFNK